MDTNMKLNSLFEQFQGQVAANDYRNEQDIPWFQPTTKKQSNGVDGNWFDGVPYHHKGWPIKTLSYKSSTESYIKEARYASLSDTETNVSFYITNEELVMCATKTDKIRTNGVETYFEDERWFYSYCPQSGEFKCVRFLNLWDNTDFNYAYRYEDYSSVEILYLDKPFKFIDEYNATPPERRSETNWQ